MLGRLDRFFPDISVRMSCGGTYQELDPGTVIEGLGALFPYQWREHVIPRALDFGQTQPRFIRSHEAAAGGFEEKIPAMSAGVRTHISAMKTLWNSFPEDQAPKWLSFEDILDYETRMTGEET